MGAEEFGVEAVAGFELVVGPLSADGPKTRRTRRRDQGTCVLMEGTLPSKGCHEDTGRPLVFSRRAHRIRWLVMCSDGSSLHHEKRCTGRYGPRPARGHHPAAGGAVPQQ